MKANNIGTNPLHSPIVLLAGDSLAAGDTYSGEAALDAEGSGHVAEVWNGNQWVEGADGSAHVPGQAGLFAQAIARHSRGGRFHRAVSPGQSISALTAASSSEWTTMSSAVLNSWMQPSVLVYFGGAADARSDVSAEAYRQNLHRLWHRSRELGCRSMVIVHPITTAHQLPLGTVENVRHGTLLFADDRLEVCVISIDDLARSDRFLANDGIHLSPLGYAECGRRVGNTLERLRCG